ncbi:MAG TPA: ABC transporter permease [Bacteroidia bacterium]|jgi:peptide/nickel transport system permease protein|nr:ABC transporter permease [Bacteroidia bacterium]
MKLKSLLYIFNPAKRADDALQKVEGAAPSQGYWMMVRKQLRKNRLAVYCLRVVYFLVVLALFADVLANEKPLACSYNNHVYFPVFRSYTVSMGINQWPAELQNAEWKKLNYSWSLFPPIPYLPGNIDEANVHSVSPFAAQQVKSTRWRHWLGTDELGHDVFAAMIYGTRIALMVGVIAMSIATLIGLILGAMAGYFGDDRLKISRIGLLFNALFFMLGIFYSFGIRSYVLSDALASSSLAFFGQVLISMIILVAVMAIGNIISLLFNRIPFLGKKVSIPVDIIVSRIIEIMISIPTLFLIIAIVAIAKPSLMLVMLVIGATTWTGIARFVRAELLRIRSLEYIEAAHALGYSEVRTIFRHALPNALSPVLIAIAFGIASAILTEATLSFLGIGVPADTLTWGALLSEARSKPTAWWLAIFPGIAIFITVTVYNLLGEGLTDAMDPRLRK